MRFLRQFEQKQTTDINTRERERERERERKKERKREREREREREKCYFYRRGSNVQIQMFIFTNNIIWIFLFFGISYCLMNIRIIVITLEPIVCNTMESIV